MTKYYALFGQWWAWMSWRLKCIIYMHRMFPIDTSTSPLPDLPSMFGWKVQTAREAQQASEEVRCWGWVHTLHQNDPKCISSFLHCPRARSCCWHGAISDNMIHMMQLRCYECERSDTHTHIHLFKGVAIFAFRTGFRTGYTQYRKMNLIFCAWVWQLWQGNLVISCHML